MKQWNSATEANRLATSADFAVFVMRSEDIEITSMDQVRPVAQAMKVCISEANANGVADDLSVAEIAAACSKLLF